MGRAMLIICAGTLVAMGFVVLSTNKTGQALTQQNVDYAEYIMAKNAAHTAIQMAMQEINEDDTFADRHDPSSSSYVGYWSKTVQGLEVRLTTSYKEDPDYWEPDSLWFTSRAQLGEEFVGDNVEVKNLFLKQPFSSLVPDFTGALQLPTDVGNFNVDGAAHEINGVPPAAHNCPESKPPVSVNSQTTKDKLALEDLQTADGPFTDDDILVDSNLNYEPTDELIERLLNSGNTQYVNDDFGSTLGTAENPGVFSIEGQVKLTGEQKTGYGILIIRADASMEMEDPTLSVAGNFEFNGLVIFENAQLFDGHGTPTINGSVLVGHTDGTVDPIDVNLGGDIAINYDCMGEKYAKQAAADAVQQNKYTQLVSTENIKTN